MSNTHSSITYILRCHSISCIPKLRTALFSVASQHYTRTQALVVLQNLSDSDLSEVESVAEHIASATGLTVQVKNFSFPRPGDYRGALLNQAIKTIESRYVAFLDYDDVVYPNHASILIEDLESDPHQEAAASFGACISAVYEDLPNNAIYIKKKSTFYDAPSVTTCVLDNCFPIHSYVIDRFRVKQFPYFNEASPYLEDYYFLLALIERHPVSTRKSAVAVCEYRINANNTNTVFTEYETNQPDENKRRKWLEAGDLINSYKQSRCFVIPFDEIRRSASVRRLARQPFFRGLFICHIAKKIRKKYGETEACEFLANPKQYASATSRRRTWLMRLLF